MKIYFDMDGTLANLYGVENWKNRLRACDSSPYEEAEPMCDLRLLARLLNKAQKNGNEIGIISWLSKEGSTAEYDEAVKFSKRRWLANHLPSVIWNEIHIVKYGTPKHFCCQDNSGILFDDNEEVRRLWDKRGKSFSEENIIEILSKLL